MSKRTNCSFGTSATLKQIADCNNVLLKMDSVWRSLLLINPLHCWTGSWRV